MSKPRISGDGDDHFLTLQLPRVRHILFVNREFRQSIAIIEQTTGLGSHPHAPLPSMAARIKTVLPPRLFQGFDWAERTSATDQAPEKFRRQFGKAGQVSVRCGSYP